MNHIRKSLSLLAQYRKDICPLFQSVQSLFQAQIFTNQFEKFIINYKNESFSRTLQCGHVTASCLILNEKHSHCLLTHHRKIGKWLQLGGHSDQETNPIKTALSEGIQESGLSKNDLSFLSLLNFPMKSHFNNALPLDIDIHEISGKPNEPRHLHYDFRFLMEARHENIKISEESLDLKWVPLNKIESFSDEESLLRLIYKINLLRQKN